MFSPVYPDKFGKNLFNSPARLLPVDLEYPVQIISNITLKHQNLFVVESKPSKLNIATLGNQLQYTYLASDYSGMVVISANLQVNSSLIGNSEYPNLKSSLAKLKPNSRNRLC
jgi:hypothetical protein